MATPAGVSGDAASIMSAIADRAEEIMHTERQSSQTGLMILASHVQGRVFRRLQQFAQLPAEVKAQADAVAVYLSSPDVAGAIFKRPHWPQRTTHGGGGHGRAVGPTTKGRTLVDAILKFLVLSRAPNASEHTAKQLAEILVLSGFVSPVHEPDDEPSELQVSGDRGSVSVADARTRTYVHSKEVVELVSPVGLHAFDTGHNYSDPNEDVPVDDLTATTDPKAAHPAKLSVWAVVDGATRAGSVFRKQPPSTMRTLLASLSMCWSSEPQGHEKRSYAVVNSARHHALFVFDDDVARQELARVTLDDALVAFDVGTQNSPMYHGLRVWNDDHMERLDFMSTRRQQEWLLTLLDAGAKYKEVHERVDEIIAGSFYELQDVDAAGNCFSLGDRFRGKVVLLVNVASNDPEAKLQYPELVNLWVKYRSNGLSVVACPSDQFLGLELSTEHAIVSHLQHAYGVRFRVLAKRDVNGPQAREAFIYCNAHSPGDFGPFTEWNFTKFLIDRHGKPFRRYETRVLPHEMEDDVRRLLGLGARDPVEAEATAMQPAKVAEEIEASTKCGAHGRDACPSCK